MSVRLKLPAVIVGAATAAAAVVYATAPSSASDASGSADLLRAGYEAVAEGDLLLGRAFFVDRSPGPQVGGRPFVATVPSMARPVASYVLWQGDQYEGFVRLKRGHEEFVCILSQREHCYRADGSEFRRR